MKVYGYIRVSSTDQNEDRQRITLNTKEVPPRNIYGQAVRQGLREATVSAARKKYKARRSALHTQHRPLGAQL